MTVIMVPDDISDITKEADGPGFLFANRSPVYALVALESDLGGVFAGVRNRRRAEDLLATVRAKLHASAISEPEFPVKKPDREMPILEVRVSIVRTSYMIVTSLYRILSDPATNFAGYGYAWSVAGHGHARRSSVFDSVATMVSEHVEVFVAQYLRANS